MLHVHSVLILSLQEVSGCRHTTLHM
uniref:Uncharacterized protein n=1 Tax=Anguilla anguilla TaxID=7936 RepID=A0A0E9TTI6_ANGAN